MAVEQYLQPDTIAGQLGAGKDGIVYRSSRNTAIKVHYYKDRYNRELNAYARLWADRVETVAGFRVPRLLRYDQTRRILELTIVSPPFVVDFAHTYIDEMPAVLTDRWDEWEAEQKEQFGTRWPAAARVFRALSERHGIYYLDLRPQNVIFRED